MSAVDAFAWFCIGLSVGVVLGAFFIVAQFDVRPKSREVRDEG